MTATDTATVMATPYTFDFQVGLLTSIIRDPDFFNDMAYNLHLTDFGVPVCRLVFEVARGLHKQHGSLPSPQMMQVEIEAYLISGSGGYTTMLSAQEYEALAMVLTSVYTAPVGAQDVTYFRSKLRDYLAYMRLAQVQAKAQYTGNATNQILETVRVHDELNKLGAIEDGDIFIDAMAAVSEDVAHGVRVGTGITSIDREINGGLSIGQLGLLIANSGGGKTVGMLNMAVSAAIRGLSSLFITLENPGSMMQIRLQAMMGNIPVHLFKLPHSEWPEDALQRLAWINGSEFKIAGRITVADLSRQSCTVDDIERLVVSWRKKRTEQFGENHDDAPLVCVDWVEKIDSTGCPGIRRNSNTDEELTKVVTYLGDIARKHNAIVWTAGQAVRGALNKEVLRRADTAKAIHMHDPVDLSLGVTVRAGGSTADAQYGRTPGGQAVQAGSRELNISFMKTRESLPSREYVTIFQGPTLRFWESAAMAAKAQRQLASGNLAEYFGG